MVSAWSRRLWLTSALAGCAAPPERGAPRGAAWLQPWLRVSGGFVGGPPGPARTVVRFVRPHAVAVRGFDLLVADLALQRLWRVDPVAQTLTPIPGVTLTPQSALLLGPDGSAWVLDTVAGRVQRYSREGRLLQTWRPGGLLPGPVSIALADAGATLLVADGTGAQWSEQRSPGAPRKIVQPQREGGMRVGGVDAIADVGDRVAVLDRLARAVHIAARDGTVLSTLGRDDLVQPVALGADRRGRVFVLEADGAVKRLEAGRPALSLPLPRAAALAVGDDELAVVDALRAEVSVYRIGPGS